MNNIQKQNCILYVCHAHVVNFYALVTTYRAMFAMAKQTAARTLVSFDVSKLQINSNPPTKLRTISPALLAFLIQGLNAQAALAYENIFLKCNNNKLVIIVMDDPPEHTPTTPGTQKIWSFGKFHGIWSNKPKFSGCLIPDNFPPETTLNFTPTYLLVLAQAHTYNILCGPLIINQKRCSSCLHPCTTTNIFQSQTYVPALFPKDV